MYKARNLKIPSMFSPFLCRNFIEQKALSGYFQKSRFEVQSESILFPVFFFLFSRKKNIKVKRGKTRTKRIKGASNLEAIFKKKAFVAVHRSHAQIFFEKKKKEKITVRQALKVGNTITFMYYFLFQIKLFR